MLTWLKPNLLLLPMILIGTGACVTSSTGIAIKGDYCRIAKPITFDGKADTAETITQIQLHNSQYMCVCENDCPRPSPGS